MKKLFLLALCIPLCIGCKKEDKAATTAAAPATAEAKPQEAEFADAKYTEIGKKAIDAMTKGDIDGWLANYADDAKYFWNAGDSLVGKPAIDKFWRNRRANVIETISFKNDIWFPIKINKAQQGEKTGVWLMGWYQVTAKYKNGGSMTQWMHILYHFNDQDKIDEVDHFVDMKPIEAAMPKKK